MPATSSGRWRKWRFPAGMMVQIRQGINRQSQSEFRAAFPAFQVDDPAGDNLDPPEDDFFLTFSLLFVKTIRAMRLGPERWFLKPFFSGPDACGQVGDNRAGKRQKKAPATTCRGRRINR
jgi:hypothetical protein